MRPTALFRPENARGQKLYDLLLQKQIHVSKLHRLVGCAYHKVTNLLYAEAAPDFNGRQISRFLKLGIPLEIVCPELDEVLKG